MLIHAWSYTAVAAVLVRAAQVSEHEFWNRLWLPLLANVSTLQTTTCHGDLS